jgi:hypothetical protein
MMMVGVFDLMFMMERNENYESLCSVYAAVAIDTRSILVNSHVDISMPSS